MPLSSVAGDLIVKTAPVISYDDLYSLGIEYQIDEYPLGPRMFHRIVDCLLSDAQQVALDRLGQGPKSAIDFDLRVDGGVMRQSSRGLG